MSKNEYFVDGKVVPVDGGMKPVDSNANPTADTASSPGDGGPEEGLHKREQWTRKIDFLLACIGIKPKRILS